jgi:maltooligosyltrehalose trehalohydrolase
MLGERTSELLSFDMQKLMAAAVIFSPYIPLLFMGEEWSAPHPFQYFVDHSDAALIEGVRKGRREEFAAFHIQGEAPDPVSKEVFEQSTLQWELLGQGRHVVMWEYYKTLLHLRKNHPVLKETDRRHVQVECEEAKGILKLCRWQQDQSVWCFMNFSTQPQTIKAPGGNTWFTLLNSADEQWSETPGQATPGMQAAGAHEYLLQPQSVLLLGSKPFTIQF